MFGIVGYINFHNTELIARLAAKIQHHRGADDQNLLISLDFTMKDN